MSDPVRGFLPAWHRIVAEKDLEALGRALSPDVELGSPPYWEPLRGHDVVHHLLGLILATIEDFTYRRQWQDGRELALEFEGRVGEHALQGIDLVTLDAEGRIARLDVAIRPLDAVLALRDAITPKMTAFFAERAAR